MSGGIIVHVGAMGDTSVLCRGDDTWEGTLHVDAGITDGSGGLIHVPDDGANRGRDAHAAYGDDGSGW
jgi:hypothetical protein